MSFNILGNSKSDSCKPCSLYGRGDGFSLPEGLGTLGVAIIGEASGENEEYDGLPFRPMGDSGAVLERAFRRLGYTRSQFIISNIIRCRPRIPGLGLNEFAGTDQEASAIAHCQQYLDKFIADFKPKAILALGGVAFKALTGMAGRAQGITLCRGYAVMSPRYGIPVIGSNHPSFLRRGKMSNLGVLINDLKFAVGVAANGLPPKLPVKYVTAPTISDAQSFIQDLRANPSLLLSYDIETAYSPGMEEDEREVLGKQITLVQFSLRPGEAIAFPWEEQYKPFIREALAGANPKVGANNWIFDDDILAFNDCPVKGVIHDIQWAWHHLQPDLPRNLQFLCSFYIPEEGPWKHLSGVNLADYGCKDVDYVQRVWPRIEKNLRNLGIWRGYAEHVEGLWPILKATSERGLPSAPEVRKAFAEELGVEMRALDVELQALHPLDLRNCEPKNGYKKPPKDTLGMVEREFPSIRYDLCACAIETFQGAKQLIWADPDCVECKGHGAFQKPSVETRWCRLLPFAPSSQQLTRYIKHKGHKVPTAPGSDRETTERLGMERLAKKTGDRFYHAYLDYKRHEKMRGAYVGDEDGEGGWEPGPDGRIHATFYFSPATGQLAAKNPNVMTSPNQKKLGRFADRFKQIIAARPGHCLAAMDFAAFHAMTLAYEAKDPVYMRVAGIDPHSFLTARMLRLNDPEALLALSDDELRSRLNWIKENYGAVRDGKAKPGLLGFGFGLGARKLYDLNQETFDSQSEAKDTVDMLRRTFPRTVAFQTEVRHLAARQTYLKSAHGYMRWFWDVFHIDPRSGATMPGEQSEAAIAYLPSNDAHGHIKDALIRMDAQGWLDKYNLVNIIHDEVLFEPPIALLDEWAYNIGMEMERPSTILIDPLVAPGGLVVRAEPKAGLHWAGMKSLEKFKKELVLL